MTDFVYFISNENLEVKIGTTTDVKKRLCYLQCATTNKLKCIGVASGDRKVERYLHKKFDAFRISNEWFRLVGDIEQWISNNTVEFDDVLHSKKARTNARFELGIAAQILRDMAGPALAGDSVTKQIERVAAKLPSLGFNRIKSIWYRDPRVRIDGDELAVIRRAAQEGMAGDDMSAMLRSAISRIEELERQVRLLKHSLDKAKPKLELVA